MWLHDMNGGSGGGGGGFIALLFLLIYATTFVLLGKKLGGIWSGGIAVVLSIGVPLLLDARSNWSPTGAIVYMIIAWIVALPTLILISIATWIGERPPKPSAHDSPTNVTPKGIDSTRD